MSTRCIIAVADEDFATTGNWHGVYHHHSGYVHGTFKMLHEALHGKEIVGKRQITGTPVETWPEYREKYLLSELFEGKPQEMFKFILSHTAGWSDLWAKPCSCDLPARPAGVTQYEANHREMCYCATEFICYCHWQGREEPQRPLPTNKQFPWDVEWILVVDLKTGQAMVGSPTEDKRGRQGVKYQGSPFNFFDPTEPDWEEVYYGADAVRLFREYQVKPARFDDLAKCPNGHVFAVGEYRPGDTCCGDPRKYAGMGKNGKPRYTRAKKCDHIFRLEEDLMLSGDDDNILVLPDEVRKVLSA